MRSLPVLRASATNRWTNCTWFSTHHFPATPGGPAAQKGQRVHAAIATALGVTESLTVEGPDEQAMADAGIAYANMLRTEYPAHTVLVERLTERAGIRGTVDFALVGTEDAVLVDWKTGQRHDGYEPQMLTYALLLRSVYPQLSRVTVRLVYLSIGEVDEVVFDTARIDEHNDAVMVATSRREEEAPTATPGQWCQWCPGKLQGCPAYAGDEAALATTDHSLAVALPSLLAPIVDASVARSAAKFLGFAKESLELIEANLKAYVRDGGEAAPRRWPHLPRLLHVAHDAGNHAPSAVTASRKRLRCGHQTDRRMDRRQESPQGFTRRLRRSRITTRNPQRHQDNGV